MRGRSKDTTSTRHQGRMRLDAMYKRGKGSSKHIDKRTGRGMKDKIYSENTLKDYRRKWCYYCDAMNKDGYLVNGHKPRTLEEASGYMKQYVDGLKARNLKSWTVRSYASAAAKVLGISAADYDLPARHTSDITRSRGKAVRDAHFSASQNADLTTFAECTGLRNMKELQKVKGTDLIQRADGSYALAIVGKGGRYRESTIYGTPAEVQAVVDRCLAAGSSRVWGKVHTAADIHACRALYAAKIYKSVARDPATLPKKERYCCRGANAGKWYDRAALLKVSEELGHGPADRCGTVVRHYMYRLDEV